MFLTRLNMRLYNNGRTVLLWLMVANKLQFEIQQKECMSIHSFANSSIINLKKQLIKNVDTEIGRHYTIALQLAIFIAQITITSFPYQIAPLKGCAQEPIDEKENQPNYSRLLDSFFFFFFHLRV